METDEHPTGQALLAALRQHADPRRWLICHEVAAIISIAHVLMVQPPTDKKDELIDRILLAEWNQQAR
jgi:hypothetical protein